MDLLSEIVATHWVYETDYRLAHIDGLKVDFSESHTDPDPAARQSARGDYVAGTVIASRRRAVARGATKSDAMRETHRLFAEARLLYRNLPAGSADAPRSPKRDRMRALAELRRKASQDLYGHLADFHEGRYDCDDHVSPFTKAADNFDSRIFVLLLDWASRANLRNFDQDLLDRGYSKDEPTTRELSRLLNEHFRLRLDQVFATNLFPFIRDEVIRPTDLRSAATDYAIAQIDIVQPELVICVGLDTFNALRQATGLRSVNTLDEALNNPFKVGVCGACAWAQAHTGYWGQKRGAERVALDWRAMVNWYAI